ncbi:NfeD family protein [Aeromicrobium sp. 636]|uniref:NfeD family protein n=1 Tax=Aeromicrobium senzhongii TaxID=2663859 RepID=A0A8I0ERA4_9ACTN|nr:MULTISPECIES: NfeD family protein [Aeromicrobium]MBC9224956.1 NfeD family protein [Aeromicrobium senzhongii]MCQ3997067.1 NfeD family protein [Aeromicrobium sp. 636]MTB87001.1 NfeD family protein [Aeromicrobium senzhongii]QNL93173.1 NfeD family protein [Aeromicrobium senzhongii]
MDWFGDDIWVTWTALGVILCLIELASGELIFLMFGIAAFSAAVAAAAGAPLAIPLGLFGVVSVALLALVRPRIVARLYDGPSLPSGQHGLVGHSAIVDEEVNRLAGRVLIGDVLWTARPVDPEAVYEPGDELLVAAIDGAIARVVRKES